MTRFVFVALVALAGCAPPHPVPRAAPADVRALVGTVRREWGPCGALVVGPHTAVVPGHCVPHSELTYDGQPATRGACRELQDVCDVELPGPARVRVAALREPRPGELVFVSPPARLGGPARVLEVSARWRAAWLDWPCQRGDSGAVAWGGDGAAVCLLVGCAGDGGPTYCEVLP